MTTNCHNSKHINHNSSRFSVPAILDGNRKGIFYMLEFRIHYVDTNSSSLYNDCKKKIFHEIFSRKFLSCNNWLFVSWGTGDYPELSGQLGDKLELWPDNWITSDSANTPSQKRRNISRHALLFYLLPWGKSKTQKLIWHAVESSIICDDGWLEAIFSVEWPCLLSMTEGRKLQYLVAGRAVVGQLCICMSVSVAHIISYLLQLLMMLDSLRRDRGVHNTHNH